MCGIAGIVGAQSSDWIETMCGTIAHRGMDGFGVYRDENLSLGHQRLSIIDEAGGRQPMSSNDSRYVLVFNGEIFNAAEIRLQLEAHGVCFTSDHSDTEVLLNLLIREREHALSQLNGMFAFAFLDCKSRTLFCARDRFGIKPLFYYCKNGHMAFASELKALLTLPIVERSPNLSSVFHFFSLQYVPGEETAFNSISRLEAGCWLSYDLDRCVLRKEKWWTPGFSSNTKFSLAEQVEDLTDTITGAVDRWSISDVPIGCLLSGGLDSSAIVSLLAQKGHSLKTYTVGFTGDGEMAWDETQLARKIAEKWGTDHHEIILDPASLLDDLIDMVYALEEPYGGGLPSWAVFKAMGNDLKVAMTGTGGDELFGNYNKFVLLEGRFRGMVPGLARQSVNKECFDRHYFQHYCYASDHDKREFILTNEFCDHRDTLDYMWDHFNDGPLDEGLRDRVVRVDLATQLPEEFLMMTDRFSMAHSIEARTPFLDKELSEKIYAIHSSKRLNRHEYKPLLRKVVSSILPDELMQAPKRGFVIPLNLWLGKQLRPLLERLLVPDRLQRQGLVQTDFLARFALPHFQGKADHTNRLWNMLMFQLWWDVFILQRPRDELSAEVKGIA